VGIFLAQLSVGNHIGHRAHRWTHRGFYVIPNVFYVLYGSVIASLVSIVF